MSHSRPKCWLAAMPVRFRKGQVLPPEHEVSTTTPSDQCPGATGGASAFTVKVQALMPAKISSADDPPVPEAAPPPRIPFNAPLWIAPGRCPGSGRAGSADRDCSRSCLIRLPWLDTCRTHAWATPSRIQREQALPSALSHFTFAE